MIIKAIQKIPRKKTKQYMIEFDAASALIVSENVLKRLGCTVADQLSDEEFRRLKHDAFFYHGEELLLRFLQYRMRSEKEIRTKLSGEHISSSIIDELIEKFKRLGYINDNIFAEKLLMDLITYHPQGKYALQQKLRQRGICHTTISSLLDTHVPRHIEEQMAEHLMKSKLHSFSKLPLHKATQKLLSFLQRKGFSASIAYHTARCMKEKLNDLNEKKDD